MTGIRAKVALMTRAGMVAMSMSNKGSLNRTFWVDVEIASRAIKTGRRYGEHINVIVQVDEYT